MIKKILIFVVLVLVAAALYIGFANRPAPLEPTSVSAQWLAKGPFEVEETQRSLEDTSRSTDANNDYPGAKTRTIEVFIWRPKTKPATPQPLLIYSHGFMSRGREAAYLGEYLASHGYTMVGLQFPLTNRNAPGGARVQDVVNQPGDVSFVLDTLLAENSDSESAIYGTIDPNRIAAGGLSLGGMTTTLAAFHPRWGDPRISAAFSVAGPTFMFGPKYFESRSVPFLMIASPQDAIVPYSYNAGDLRERAPQTSVLTMAGASHAGFADIAKWFHWMSNPDSIGCQLLLKNLDAAEDFTDLIGTEEEGIVRHPNDKLCTLDPLPETINPRHQHRLNTLAIGGFLSCQFGTPTPSGSKAPDAGCTFLEKTLPSEQKETTISIP